MRIVKMDFDMKLGTQNVNMQLRNYRSRLHLESNQREYCSHLETSITFVFLTIVFRFRSTFHRFYILTLRPSFTNVFHSGRYISTIIIMFFHMRTCIVMVVCLFGERV